MADALEGARTKVARAEEHIDGLRTEWQAFVDTDAYGIAVDLNPQEDSVWYLISFRVLRPVPPRISAIAGDIVHNLRSALDYVAAEIVAHHGGDVARSAFPLYIKAEHFKRDVRDRDERKRGPGPLNGVPHDSDAWGFVERNQPYNRADNPRDDALFALNYFSNRDKHRALVPALGSVLGEDGLSFVEWSDRAVVRAALPVWQAGMPLHDRTPLAEIWFDLAGADPKLKGKDPAAIDVAFGAGPNGPTGDAGFGAMFREVAQIVSGAEVLSL